MCAAVLFVLWPGAGYAQELEHYVNGIEGIKAGSLPPPGFYYRMYNVIYTADKLKDKHGDNVHLDPDIDVFAQLHRLIWVTPVKVLGADYAVDFGVPWTYTDFNMNAIGLHDNNKSIGDLLTHPIILSWHGPQYDACAAMGFFFPTGERSINAPADPHKDYVTFMPTWGGTYYFDKERTWSASFLARYEMNAEARHEALRAGDNFHFEWGVGKSFCKFWEAGVAGYAQWQTTHDQGTFLPGPHHDLDRVYAIGPELSYMFAPLKLEITVRSEWEFGAPEPAGRQRHVCAVHQGVLNPRRSHPRSDTKKDWG
jgi:hypothetical protein